MDRRKFVAGLALSGLSSGRKASADEHGLIEDARIAWLYVLPLIEMAGARDRTSRRLNGRAIRSNVIAHARYLAGPESREITTPNADTIYSTAFIDLTIGPVSLVVPDAGQRYISVSILDMFTNTNIIMGTSTLGGGAGSYRLIGPKETARDNRDLRVLTPHSWLIARISMDGEDDLAQARQIQEGIKLEGPEAPLASTFATRISDWPEYFRAAQALLESDPPTFTVGLDAFERIRAACSSRDFARSEYSKGDAQAIDAGVSAARNLIQSLRGRQAFVHGWSYPRPELGNYADNYVYRAVVAVVGLGALPPQEAMYMRAAGDDGTGLYRGDGLYRLSLPKPPPVKAFWSLTMYEATPDGQFFLAPNSINRYVIGNQTKGLIYDSDGVLDIWIGRKEPPSLKRANWLPAPDTGPFALTLRAYLPGIELLNGKYHVPAVTSESG
jgi:hypothetical protein